VLIKEGDYVICNVVGGGYILGSLCSADGKGVVCIEDCFDIDIDEVWLVFIDFLCFVCWYGEVEGDLCFLGEYCVCFFVSGWEGIGCVEVCEFLWWLLVCIKDVDELDE